MATLYEVAKEIHEETGIDTHTVMEVLKSLGNAVLKAIEKDPFGEARVHIPGFGVLKIEKEKRKKYPSMLYYPAPLIQDYLKHKTI